MAGAETTLSASVERRGFGAFSATNTNIGAADFCDDLRVVVRFAAAAQEADIIGNIIAVSPQPTVNSPF